MNYKKWSLILGCTCVLFASCLDLYTKEYKIDGPYFVQSDPAADSKTLYYKLDDGNAIGRVRFIKKVGHTNKFIIAEVQDGYYFIDREKDHQFLNGDEIIGPLRTHDYFIHWLDSLKIDNFKFDFDIEK